MAELAGIICLMADFRYISAAMKHFDLYSDAYLIACVVLVVLGFLCKKLLEYKYRYSRHPMLNRILYGTHSLLYWSGLIGLAVSIGLLLVMIAAALSMAARAWRR